MAKPILNPDITEITLNQGDFVDVTVRALQRRLTFRGESAEGEEVAVQVGLKPSGLIVDWYANIDPPFTVALQSSDSLMSVWRVSWPL